MESLRPPVPPFNQTTAIQKVRIAEDAWKKNLSTGSSKNSGRIKVIGLLCGFAMSGMMILGTGFAPMAARIGSLTTMDICVGELQASTIFALKKVLAGFTGGLDAGLMTIQGFRS